MNRVGEVREVEGVPIWFTKLVHLYCRRRCRRIGHVGSGGGIPIFTCTHCGEILSSSRDWRASS